MSIYLMAEKSDEAIITYTSIKHKKKVFILPSAEDIRDLLPSSCREPLGMIILKFFTSFQQISLLLEDMRI